MICPDSDLLKVEMCGFCMKYESNAIWAESFSGEFLKVPSVLIRSKTPVLGGILYKCEFPYNRLKKSRVPLSRRVPKDVKGLREVRHMLKADQEVLLGLLH